MTDWVQPNFYKQIAQLSRDCIQSLQIKPFYYCDIGGATGRTLYEISKQIPDLTELVLVEPSPVFCE